MGPKHAKDFPVTLRHKPGGLWWSYDGCEHLFWLPWRSDGPLVLASVLGGGRLRQAEREGGTFAGRQDREFAGVDGGRRGLRERHLWAPLLAFVLHYDLFKWLSPGGERRGGLGSAEGAGSVGALMYRTS